MHSISKTFSRRQFLARAGVGVGASAGALHLVGQSVFPRGRAKRCIMIWLGGGMSHLDTFDPKRIGDPKDKKPGSAYASIPTNRPGIRVSEHLARCSQLMDRMTVIRSMHHEVIDEHAAAVIRVHTGRPTSGTIQYPSIGSIVSHELGAADQKVPPYVVIGYPNIARDPGFLGPSSGYLYVPDTESGPNGLNRPPFISKQRQKRREKILSAVRGFNDETGQLGTYGEMLDKSLKLAGPDFMSVFQLERESTSLRESYGGEFGQRCLLARRLVERGVRFVEVSHNLNFSNGTGWDTHFEGQKNQHLLIRELDQALSSLILDLEDRSELDETLIVVGTEFGRPASFDARGGRGHFGKAFSLVLAGGGLKHQGAYGVTNELGQKILDSPVSVPDFHASILAALGVDPSKELFADERPVPVTDGGRPISALFG
jgi:hypothetical protein